MHGYMYRGGYMYQYGYDLQMLGVWAVPQADARFFGRWRRSRDSII